MTTLPTPEECARNILAIYKRQNVRTGEMLLRNALQSNFVNGGRADDFSAGLDYCVENGWLKTKPDKTNMYFLTEVGFAQS